MKTENHVMGGLLFVLCMIFAGFSQHPIYAGISHAFQFLAVVVLIIYVLALIRDHNKQVLINKIVERSEQLGESIEDIEKRVKRVTEKGRSK